MNQSGAIHANQQEFQTLVASGKTLLVDFYAPWCGPCKVMAPIFDELANEHPDVTFVKINVDEESDLAGQYNVSSIPTFVVFKNGQPANQVIGGVPKNKLKALLETN